MAVCEICGKRRLIGNNVSHANNRNKRTFNVNIQQVKMNKAGRSKKGYVCTTCIKAGKVEKA